MIQFSFTHQILYKHFSTTFCLLFSPRFLYDIFTHRPSRDNDFPLPFLAILCSTLFPITSRRILAAIFNLIIFPPEDVFRHRGPAVGVTASVGSAVSPNTSEGRHQLSASLGVSTGPMESLACVNDRCYNGLSRCHVSRSSCSSRCHPQLGNCGSAPSRTP